MQVCFRDHCRTLYIDLSHGFTDAYDGKLRRQNNFGIVLDAAIGLDELVRSS